MWSGDGGDQHDSEEIMEIVKQAHVVEWGGRPGEPRTRDNYQMSAIVTEDPKEGAAW